MRGWLVAAHLMIGAMVVLGLAGSTAAASLDCSLPIGQLTAAEFDRCLRLARAAKTGAAETDKAEYLAPKPTTQRAYDELLHAGG